MGECSLFAIQMELLPALYTSEPQFSDLINHLQICAACRGKFQLSQKLDELIKDRMANISVPLLLREKITAKYADLTSDGDEWFYRDQDLPTHEPIAQKLNWLAVSSLQHHLGLIDKNKQLITDKKLKFPKPKVIADIPFTNDVLYNNRLNWNKCSLGDVEAAFILFEEAGLAGSLYLLPEDEAELKHWSGEKQVIQQGDYRVSIWKSGEMVYSKVLKQA
ncbi:MAG: hypothetical protein HZA78_10320 [Candidatus Schekmanbacteria bacterium]|nr:hypothetical protein [Candidatus Schekmanbacteria bacterium]